MISNYWWGYLHSNGKLQINHWLGDVKDFKDDSENYPFVIKIVKPFLAENRDEAIKIAMDRLENQITFGL